MTRARRRVGVPPHFYCRPLLYGLARQERLDVMVDTPLRNAIKMRERDLDIALLTPIDYARESSDYTIVPAVAASSATATETITLCFREGLRTIRTLAVDPSATSEIVLAAILLTERLDLKPTIVPMTGSLGRMLEAADAALLVGDAAIREGRTNPHRLDLVEEWQELTGLPYVHNFWCLHAPDVMAEDVRELQRACRSGVVSLGAIAGDAAKAGLLAAEDAGRQLHSFSYLLSDEAQAGLHEFMRYAYYHGVLPDVPDLNLYRVEESDGSPAPDPFEQ